jgi:exonuclease SbcD
MRILHTADWHLGRVLHGASLLEDQAQLLDQLVALVGEERPDVVVVAGDVYDRAVPPPQAVELLDDVMCRLILDQKCRVVLVAGNHDSATRIGFGSRVLAERGLEIRGPVDVDAAPVVVEDKHGPFWIYPLPYAEPAVVRHVTGMEELQGHEAAMQALVDRVRAHRAGNQRSMLVAHCFVDGLAESESERPLSVGGASAVRPEVLAGFSFVALGHLHQPQCCGGGRIHYSGSLMPYAFSEADHDKAVSLVEIDSAGHFEIEPIRLSPRRAVRCIEGTITQVLADAAADPAPDDYLTVKLLDRGPVFDAMGRLREVYPNVLHVERPALLGSEANTGERLDHRRMGLVELFDAFIEQATGEPLDEEEREVYAELVDRMRRDEREDAR